MRRIKKIIWHCSATKEGNDVKIDTIRDWHVNDRGWSDIGYHFVIELDGAIRIGRPVIKMGAHVKGHNEHSIGVCYVGGIAKNGKPKDTRTDKQRASLYDLTAKLLSRFPGATVHGHNEFAAKACPCFDAQSDWRGHALTLDIAREEIEEEEIV